MVSLLLHPQFDFAAAMPRREACGFATSSIFFISLTSCKSSKRRSHSALLSRLPSLPLEQSWDSLTQSNTRYHLWSTCQWVSIRWPKMFCKGDFNKLQLSPAPLSPAALVPCLPFTAQKNVLSFLIFLNENVNRNNYSKIPKISQNIKTCASRSLASAAAANSPALMSFAFSWAVLTKKHSLLQVRGSKQINQIISNILN